MSWRSFRLTFTMYILFLYEVIPQLRDHTEQSVYGFFLGRMMVTEHGHYQPQDGPAHGLSGIVLVFLFILW